MSQKTVIRAWKDPDFRMGLSAEERSSLPANPAGMKELADADLGDVAGGGFTLFTWCDSWTTCEPPTCCNSMCSVNVTCPGRSRSTPTAL